MPVLTDKRAKIRQTDFSGGQNSGSEPSTLKPTEAELLANCIITERGKCEQRGGLARTGDNPDTLISHWTFDDASSVDDKADNDGTDTAITYVAGKFGKAASFNGTTSLITVTADTTIDVNSMGAFRLSAWIYVDSDGENDEGRIFDKFSSTNIGYRLFVFGQSAGTVKLDFEVGHATTNTRVITSTTLTTGAWHKVDAVYNSDKSGDIYINGVLATYSTDTTGVDAVNDDSAVDLIIGNNSGATRTFDGEIDDARIYDGSFTADDVEIKPILGLTVFAVGSTYNKPIRAKDTAIQELNSNFKTWDNITGLTTLTAGLTTNFVQAQDKLFILNGTDNVFSIDSSLTVTDEGDNNGDPPKTTFGEWASNNRLFLSGSLTIADRDIVWFSDSQNSQAFNRSSNRFLVRSGSGGKITWLKMFKEFELIIYKSDGIYVLNMDGATPLTDWTVKPLSIAIGCPAGRTVQDIGNDHIFLANDGVRLLSRTTFDKLRVGVISEPIQDIIDTINEDAVQNSCAWFENGLYILGFPVGTSTTPNRFVIWDSTAAQRNGDPNSAWTTVPTDAWNLTCFTSFAFGDNKKTIIGGDGRALSLCYKVLSGNTDNGAAIIQTITTKEQDYGDPFVDKIFDPIQVISQPGQNGLYSIQMDVDRSGFTQIDNVQRVGNPLVTPFTTPTATVVVNEDTTKNFRTKFKGRGKSARLKFENSVYNTNPTFLEYTMFARPYGGRI
jgi:hypothetical protein